jgi:hypothetical protein
MKKYKIPAIFCFFNICDTLDNRSKNVKGKSRMLASDCKLVENS